MPQLLQNMKNLRILIVDDFDTMVRIIRNILIDLGYTRIVSAKDGIQACQVLEKQKIDFIISDWNMPKMTGLELLKKVRETPEWASIPFLMVTAEADKSMIMEAVNAKVSQYVIKPFTHETLKSKIESAIRNQENLNKAS
jgi:two-component system chemotaxis response regulator CheY